MKNFTGFLSMIGSMFIAFCFFTASGQAGDTFKKIDNYTVNIIENKETEIMITLDDLENQKITIEKNINDTEKSQIQRNKDLEENLATINNRIIETKKLGIKSKKDPGPTP